MSNLKLVNDDDEFDSVLKGAGDELVIIDFYTSWCRPCKTMEPVFEAMAIHYPKALFLRVDADKCFNTAMNYKVRGVPFFVIYFNKSVVETIQGANPNELELKIRYAEIESRRAAAAVERSRSFGPSVNPTISTFGKLGTISPYIDHDNCHCLNDLSPTSFHTFIQGKKLLSGGGTGKILLVYSFTQKMMLQSFKIKANPQAGPKVLRFFVNHPKVLDFNVGSTLAPSQEVTLSHQDLTGERAIELRSGSFQVVTNVQLFVTSGQSRNSKIEIDSLELFGAPVLAIQPLLAVDSLLPSTTVTSAKSGNANSNPQQQRRPHQPSANDNNSDSDSDDARVNKVCDESSCCVKKQPPRQKPYQQPQQPQQQPPQPQQQRPSQHRPKPSSNANTNYSVDQLPGHSKYLIQDVKAEESGHRNDMDRNRHRHEPKSGDRDHHHHHSHSRQQ